MIKKLVSLGVAFFLLSAIALVPGTPAYAQSEEEEPEPKVTICHRTNSATNPYVSITVDANAVDGEAGNSGNEADHYGEHKGPLASSVEIAKQLKKEKTEWGDIIPPVGEHSGLNWTEEGQAMLRNNCNYVVAPVVAAATVTVVPATCEAPGKLQYNVETDVTNAAFAEGSTPSGTVGPTTYEVVAVADDNAFFAAGAGVSEDRETKTWTGTLSATLTGADCVLGETPVTPVTPSGSSGAVVTPAILPETGAATPAIVMTVMAAITGVLTALGFGLRTYLANKL